MRIVIDGHEYTDAVVSFVGETIPSMRRVVDDAVEIEHARAADFRAHGSVTIKMASTPETSALLRELHDRMWAPATMRASFTCGEYRSPIFEAWTLKGLMRKGRKWMHALRRARRAGTA